MKVEFKSFGDRCPICSRIFSQEPEQFYFRGHFFPGLVCKVCNSLWAVAGNNIWEQFGVSTDEKAN